MVVYYGFLQYEPPNSEEKIGVQFFQELGTNRAAMMINGSHKHDEDIALHITGLLHREPERFKTLDLPADTLDRLFEMEPGQRQMMAFLNYTI